MRTGLRLLAVLVATPALATPAPAAQASPRLAPHRAVYELSLLRAGGARPIEAATGRIAFEIAGDACKGYDLTYRQVTSLESGETGNRLSDLRNVTREGRNGDIFSFRAQTNTDGGSEQVTEGQADRTAAGVRVSLKAPARATVTATGPVLFPAAHMKRLIAAAQASERTVAVKVFDGSDDGRKVYDTLAVIGAARPAADADAAEAPLRQGSLRTMPRWPVTLSYFAPGGGDGRPIYTLSFDLYENGISGALRLDYGDFALKGETTRIDLLPDSKDCRS